MISKKTIDSAVNTVVDSAEIAKNLSKLTKRNSIMRMAAPGMYQYPLMISGGVDTDSMMAIMKGQQATFASAVVTAYSLNPILWTKDYPNISDYVKKFHTNDEMDVNFNTARTALGIESSTATEEGDENEEDAIAIESAMVATNVSPDLIQAINDSAWDVAEEGLDMSPLNDMYRPYVRTERIMREKLDALKGTPATEGKFSDFVDSAEKQVDTFGKHVEDIVSIKEGGDNYNTDRPLYGAYSKEPVIGKNGKPVTDKDGNPIYRTKRSPAVSRNYNNAVVRNDKLEAMEPTMVNVQVLCHGKDNTGAGVQYTQNVTLGVKVMPRVVSSDIMIASMIEAVKESHGIFKFLKWTKGELKTLDFVLGITASKRKALMKNARIETQILEQSKKRKKLATAKKAINNNLFPILNVVITSYEAEKIREATSTDLNLVQNALKLMNKYYLLSFGIVDTEQGTIKIIFDGDREWGMSSINATKSMINKTTDILNQNKVMQIFGRQ